MIYYIYLDLKKFDLKWIWDNLNILFNNIYT